jgi:hypothetical protein
MELGGSFQCSQEPTTYSFPDPHQCSPQLPSLFPQDLLILLSLFPYAFYRRRIFLFYLWILFRHLVGLLGRGISPASRPLAIHGTTQTHRNADTHPYPEEDSNLRSQCSSGRREYMP